MKFLIFDALQAIIITGVGHEYPLSIWWVFKVQKSGILDGLTFCYRGKIQNPAVSSSKVSFFTFSRSGRPILPYACMKESFCISILHTARCCLLFLALAWS